MEDIKRIKNEITNNREIVWQAPAFKYYEKSVSWYWLSLIIAILLMALAIWQKNFLFAVFVFLAEIAIFVWARRQPELLKFKINEEGVEIAEKLYSYENLENFCLRPDNENPNFAELILKRKTPVNPYLKILVEVRLASRAKEILSQKLAESVYEDSVLEAIFRWLRF